MLWARHAPSTSIRLGLTRRVRLGSYEERVRDACVSIGQFAGDRGAIYFSLGHRRGAYRVVKTFGVGTYYILCHVEVHNPGKFEISLQVVAS